MDQVRKAMDSLLGANYARQDLSALVSLQDGPTRPILQAQSHRTTGQMIPKVGSVPAKGKLHYWDEQPLAAADGTTAGYQEGGKPTAQVTSPVQIINQIARFGRTAAVTDTMAAVWTGAGSYTLADGELERLYAEALDFDTELKTSEVLNEIEWCWVNGVAANSTATSVPNSPSVAANYQSVISQFNGLITILTGTGTTVGGVVANYGNAVVIDATQSPYNSVFTEQILRDAGRLQARNKTPYRLDLLLCTDGQLEVINNFRPSIITMANDGLTGGGSVDYYNTGFGKVTVAYEPQMPLGTMILTSTALLKNAPLIKLGAEPLARVQTQVERMITCEMTVEVRVQKAQVVVTGLPV